MQSLEIFWQVIENSLPLQYLTILIQSDESKLLTYYIYIYQYKYKYKYKYDNFLGDGNISDNVKFFDRWRQRIETTPSLLLTSKLPFVTVAKSVFASGNRFFEAEFS